MTIATDEVTIRAKIVTRIQTVANVGNVYDNHRFTDDWSQYKSLFGYTVGSDVLLRTWFVSCEAVLPEGFVSSGSFGTSDQVILRYKIRGYFGLDDSASSEESALAIAMAVQDALNDNATFVGIAAYTATLAQLNPFTHVTWGGALCHYAEITQDFYVVA
jgi:hypothetical protein